MEQLKSSGAVVRGYLGVKFADLNDELVRWVNEATTLRAADTKDLRAKLKYGDATGVFIFEVIENGPAAKAGLRLGDLVTEFNGENVTSMPELKERIAKVAPGEDVPLKYLRGGQEQGATIRVARRPAAGR